MRNFDENLIQVTEYEVLSKLPDLFTMEDGSKVTNPSFLHLFHPSLEQTHIHLHPRARHQSCLKIKRISSPTKIKASISLFYPILLLYYFISLDFMLSYILWILILY